MMDYQILRQRMVEEQIRSRGVSDPLVLAAMAAIEREKFVPPEYAAQAYADCALPIGLGQTISQPYIVAYMIEGLGLKGGESILEIGTGCGYAAAVLGQIAQKVITIECVAELAEEARNRLMALGCKNIEVITGDGTTGNPENAPFDAIVVTAGGPEIPPSLRDQLKIGGHLVMPVGGFQTFQELVRVTRTGEDEFTRELMCDVQFVPLIGAEGWHKSGRRPGR
ncbi:MAG: protein-L-isoaspartate(D-aspartate) O-methyltransferase [Hyphomicrobiales bacterium]|nr:protein-L-isoaspartate(D-aspartate) O-methyltransferase [Hyphomicrobiales bacterium]